jgi:uncharacterized membrane protein
LSAVDPDEAKDGPFSRADLLRVRSDAARRRRHRNTRSMASTVLVLVDLTALGATVADNHGPVRFIFGIILGLVVPGWSIVGLLKLGNAALEFSLSVGVSLALMMVTAQILITLNAWHLSGLEIATCLACLPSLLLQSRGFLQSNHSR